MKFKLKFIPMLALWVGTFASREARRALWKFMQKMLPGLRNRRPRWASYF